VNRSPLDRLRRGAGRLGLVPARFRRPKVAFVLSGGGNLGAVQVGMLRALTEAGVKPDLIVGCSVGAINGAAYAAEPNTDGVERLDRLWRRIAAGEPDLMPSRFMPVIAQMARKGEALHDQGRLAELLDDELVTKTFSGLKVPFACVATDVEAAAEYWFEHGRLVPALLASAALPAVYPAVEHRGRTFIDGGVLNEIHAAQALAMGATELYILHVGHLEDRTSEVQRPFDSAMRAYWTARRFRMAEDLRRIPEHCVVHRLPAGSNPRLRFDDFSQGAELADLAYDAGIEYLRTGRTPEPVTGPVSPPQEADDDQDALDRDLADQLSDDERQGIDPGATSDSDRNDGSDETSGADVDHDQLEEPIFLRGRGGLGRA
jgi:NTE family protein